MSWATASRSAEPAATTDMRSSAPPTCDVAIITALQEELEPVLNLLGGRELCATFTIDRFIHYTGQFDCGTRTLNVVACAAEQAGGDSAVGAVHRLKQRQPHLIVMTGICAGRQDKGIVLGDLVVADRAYHIGEGKQTPTGFQYDIRTSQTKSWLLSQLKNFGHHREWIAAISTPRPHSLRYQAEWLLCQLAMHGTAFPATEADWAEVKIHCPSYSDARKRLQDKRLFSKTGKLTAQAQKEISQIREQHYGQLIPTDDSAQPSVHFMAFASSQSVISVEKPFGDVADVVRNTGAIDMEVASLYAAADQVGADVFAVKGVCDYATGEKDDVFHAYAAEASARWMHGFICMCAQIEHAFPARADSVKADSQVKAVGDQQSRPGRSTANEIKRKMLEQRLKALTEEYQAVTKQINETLDSGQSMRLQRRADSLMDELAQIDDALRQIG